MNESCKLLALSQEELEIATLLLNKQHYRTCLSRAYYSIYYAMKALLLSQNIDVSTHKGTLRLFSQHFIKTGQFSADWAKTLGTAYELRQLSDYDTDFVGQLDEAMIILEKAKSFLIEVESFFDSANSDRPQ